MYHAVHGPSPCWHWDADERSLLFADRPGSPGHAADHDLPVFVLVSVLGRAGCSPGPVSSSFLRDLSFSWLLVLRSDQNATDPVP